MNEGLVALLSHIRREKSEAMVLALQTVITHRGAFRLGWSRRSIMITDAVIAVDEKQQRVWARKVHYGANAGEGVVIREVIRELLDVMLDE